MRTFPPLGEEVDHRASCGRTADGRFFGTCLPISSTRLAPSLEKVTKPFPLFPGIPPEALWSFPAEFSQNRHGKVSF